MVVKEDWGEEGRHRRAHNLVMEKIMRYKIRYGLVLDEELEYAIMFHREVERIRKYEQRRKVTGNSR